MVYKGALQLGRGQLWKLASLAACCAAVVVPSATATSARVINVTIEGKEFHPAALNAHAGDVLHICTKDPFSDKLFSFSRYNQFGGGIHPGGIKLHPGECGRVVLHNPTSGPINMKIFSEGHSQEKLWVVVYPRGEKLPTAPPGSTPPPSPPSKAFTLVPSLTQVENADPGELTITPTASGQGILDHTGPNGGAGKGGEWRTEYHWAVPSTLTPGKPAAIFLQEIISEVNPQQPLSFQMNAIAPDFAQALQCHYPTQSSCSKTYPYPVAADQSGSAEITIDVGFEDSHVVFHYRPSK
jgi:hypothetical protein